MKKILLATAVAAVAGTSAFAGTNELDRYTNIESALDLAAAALPAVNGQNELDFSSLKALANQHGRVKTSTGASFEVDAEIDVDAFMGIDPTGAVVEFYDNTTAIEAGIDDVVFKVNSMYWGAVPSDAEAFEVSRDWTDLAAAIEADENIASNYGLVGHYTQKLTDDIATLNGTLPTVGDAGFDTTDIKNASNAVVSLAGSINNGVGHVSDVVSMAEAADGDVDSVFDAVNGSNATGSYAY